MSEPRPLLVVGTCSCVSGVVEPHRGSCVHRWCIGWAVHAGLEWEVPSAGGHRFPWGGLHEPEGFHSSTQWAQPWAAGERPHKTVGRMPPPGTRLSPRGTETCVLGNVGACGSPPAGGRHTIRVGILLRALPVESVISNPGLLAVTG